MPSRAVLALASAVLVLATQAACSGSDEATPAGSSSPGGTTSAAGGTQGTTAAPPDTTITVPVESGGCGSVPLDAGAANVTTASAEVDGDGLPDTVRVFEAPAGEWHVRVEFGVGGSAETALEGEGVRVGGATALGAADVDGDGIDELFVQEGGGDGTTQVAFFTVNNCVVEAITYEGSPATFTVGEVPGAIFGIQCGPASDGAGQAVFVAEGRQRDDGQTFTVSSSEYVLEGDALVLTDAPTEGVAAIGDEAYVAASTFACGEGPIVGG